MDNGSILFALLGVPFWAGVVLASLAMILLLPIGVNVVIRIVIDALLAHRGDPARRLSAYERKHSRDRRMLHARARHEQ